MPACSEGNVPVIDACFQLMSVAVGRMLLPSVIIRPSSQETYPETFKWIAKRNEARQSPEDAQDAQMPQAN